MKVYGTIGLNWTQKSISYLRTLSEVFDLKFMIWLRKPQDFIQSYYIQCLKNPKSNSRPYGLDIDLDDFLHDEFFNSILYYFTIFN